MENEKKLIPETAPYQISCDMYREAYKTYQNMYVYPRNRIMQVILLLLAINFGYCGGKDSGNTLAFVLMLVCLALIFIIWYNPRKMRRSVMDVIRETEGDEYAFEMDEQKMTFRTMPPETVQDVPDEEITPPLPTKLYFTKDMKATEKDDFFLICKGKQIMYVLPKHALYDDQGIIVHETLEENLGKRFRCKV